ncbi:hypothetical protein M758_12G178100 [Ceratodon purpureus]|nr:hypothetical protein M758_12G178100 [Ceratodon purpureus]
MSDGTVHPVTTSPSHSAQGEASGSATFSRGEPPRRVHSYCAVDVVPGLDKEITQIWTLRKRGAAFPGPGDKRRPELLIFAENFWKEQQAEAAQRLDAYSSYLATSNNELYQLIGFYSVFQGVLLTASAQSNLLCCKNWWIPVSLCALSTLCTCWGVWLKLLQVRIFEEEKNHFNAQHSHRSSQLLTLRTGGADPFKGAESESSVEVKASSEEGLHLQTEEILIFSAILAFSVIILIGSVFMLCNSGCKK